VIQSLLDTVTRKDELLERINRINESVPSSFRFYETSRMDSIVTLPDKVALQLLELNYIFGTQFIPDGLPGAGEAIGD
jgi:hypothetical protein